MPRLADFGLSRRLARGRDTHETKLIGTPAYIAPEVLLGQGCTAASDVYSYGILLCELFSGAVPHAGISAYTVTRRVVAEHLRPPIPPGCPPALARILRASWAGEPTARPNMASILNGLTDLLASVHPAYASQRREAAAPAAKPSSPSRRARNPSSPRASRADRKSARRWPRIPG